MPFNTLGYLTAKIRYPKKLVCISFTFGDIAMDKNDPLVRVKNDPFYFLGIIRETKALY